jgi:hypothetical protein
MSMSSGSFQGASGFPSTPWQLMIELKQPDGKAQTEGLDHLLRRYLPALRTHLMFKFGLTEERAEDLLQDFIFKQVLTGQLIVRAERSRGLFRTFLLNALGNFVLNELRREGAKKRAPGNRAICLDDLEEQYRGTTSSQVEVVFDIAWSKGVMTEVLRRMQAECVTSGRQDLWEVFESRLLGPLLENAKPLAYDELVRHFGFESPTQVYNALTTAKRMFVRLLRSAIAEYARDEREVDIEIEEWKAAFVRAARSQVLWEKLSPAAARLWA